MNKIKIGIYGSATDESANATEKAKHLGRAIGKLSDEIIVITGATSGMSFVVASAAKKARY